MGWKSYTQPIVRETFEQVMEGVYCLDREDGRYVDADARRAWWFWWRGWRDDE